MTATLTEDSAGITKELATGKFTDKMLADMRALIGTELRTEASINNEYATRTAILRFCEGIGDDNPLWTQADYAEKTQHRSLIAPPTLVHLPEIGIRGNTHFPFSDLNNVQIADLMSEFLKNKGLD